MKSDYKTHYNLDDRIPNVLLIGNGPFRNNNKSWSKFLKESSSNKYDEFFDGDNLRISNHIYSNFALDRNDKLRRESYTKSLSNWNYDSKPECLSYLNDISFDAILTTNYTYEIENHFKKGYSTYDANKKLKYAKCLNEKELRIQGPVISLYNQIDKSPPIFHIHGEHRRKSSIVLSLDEYFRLMIKIGNYNKENGNRYEYFKNDLSMNSWIDYFLVGNIYIIGFGFDYAEYDLWWLLNRRRRERTKIGNVYFYELDKNNEDMRLKHLALENCGCKINDFTEALKEEANLYDNDEDYQKFYNLCFKDVKIKIN